MAADDIEKLPLVVIVGPTASGKTALAIKLAEQCGGEIICADSRTVYKEIDVGTAKPTAAEQHQVPHWGLDLVRPDQRFTAADFKLYAEQKIKEIRERGHIPFVVGGTGLYVDGVVYDYKFGNDVNATIRAKFENMTLEQLQVYCIKNNITLPENNKNKRYVIRAIENMGHSTSRNDTPVSTSIIVGIATEKDVLRQRIEQRIEQLLTNGVVEEASMLGKKYGWDVPAMTGNIYPLVHQYLESKLMLDELKTKSTTLDWRLAKRQLTWFRRNPDIYWLSLEEAEQFISRQLASE